MSDFTSEDRKAICDTFERVLQDRADETALRKIIDTETGFDRELWSELCELGLAGVLISSEFGGLDGSMTEVAALMEVAGEHLYCGPYITNCVIAPCILGTAHNKDVANIHLERIVTGEEIFTVAGCGKTGDWTGELEVIAMHTGNDWKLTGSAGFVAYAAASTHCIVYANYQGQPAAFVIEMGSAGLELNHYKTDDRTVRLSALQLKEVSAIRLEGIGQSEIDLAFMNGLVASASENAGAGRKIFEVTIEYLKLRYQFGQPIGSFQALQHMAADLLIEMESSVSAARAAAKLIASGANEAKEYALLAAFTAADNFRRISADAIQMHGGIAYTVEHPAHLFWRRAQTAQWLYASSDKLRDLYLSELEAK